MPDGRVQEHVMVDSFKCFGQVDESSSHMPVHGSCRFCEESLSPNRLLRAASCTRVFMRALVLLVPEVLLGFPCFTVNPERVGEQSY